MQASLLAYFSTIHHSLFYCLVMTLRENSPNSPGFSYIISANKTRVTAPLTAALGIQSQMLAVPGSLFIQDPLLHTNRSPRCWGYTAFFLKCGVKGRPKCANNASHWRRPDPRVGLIFILLFAHCSSNNVSGENKIFWNPVCIPSWDVTKG